MNKKVEIIKNSELSLINNVGFLANKECNTKTIKEKICNAIWGLNKINESVFFDLFRNLTGDPESLVYIIKSNDEEDYDMEYQYICDFNKRNRDILINKLLTVKKKIDRASESLRRIIEALQNK